jgi:hypothetical protein
VRVLIAEHEIADDGEPCVLARKVSRPGRVRLQHAGAHGIERLEHTRHGAGRKRLDDETAVGVDLEALAKILKCLVGQFRRTPHGLASPAGDLLRTHDCGRGDHGGRSRRAGHGRLQESTPVGGGGHVISSQERTRATSLGPFSFLIY